MTPYAFKIWLITTSLITFVIVFSLWFINVIFYHHELKRLSIPQMLRTQLRKLTITKLIGSCLFFLKSSADTSQMKGHRVLAQWDIRWSSYGLDLGKIIDLDDKSILIKFEKPIKFGDGEVGQAIFYPYDKNTNLNKYFFFTVNGTLEFKVEQEDYSATCELLVYK